jgi:DeoR/GlpR family transcriptional regulator of sugar metabolism
MPLDPERRMTMVIRLLQKRPVSMEELAKMHLVSERTVRRWLEEIVDRGFRLVREGVYPTSPYRILRKKK